MIDGWVFTTRLVTRRRFYFNEALVVAKVIVCLFRASWPLRSKI